MEKKIDLDYLVLEHNTILNSINAVNSNIALVGLGVLISLVYSCDNNDRIIKNSRTLSELTTVYEEQVLGNPTPETFYIIGGQRAYITIDGMFVEKHYR